MENRPRRKSVHQRKIVKPAADCESGKDSTQDSDESPKKAKTNLNFEQEETFVRKCVEHFESINDMGTVRGTKNYKQHQEKIKNAWTIITSEMNTECGVRINYYYFKSMHTNRIFFFSNISIAYQTSSFGNQPNTSKQSSRM